MTGGTTTARSRSAASAATRSRTPKKSWAMYGSASYATAGRAGQYYVSAS
ncbi:hypothetical protein [Streptomyces sp. NBC_00872]|nr:hypothetical protein OG214_02980 [Streptomyces sp. NBC_00872]